MTTLRLLIPGVLCLLIASGITQAGEYTDQVKAQMLSIKSAAFSEDRFEETHNDKYDSLDEDDSDTLTFTLKEGMEYRIYGVCDNDCSDLDMTLYDENDNEIAEDATTDDIPIVQVSPKWTGKFSLEVEMYECDDEPCFYGIAILGKEE